LDLCSYNLDGSMTAPSPDPSSSPSSSFSLLLASSACCWSASAGSGSGFVQRLFWPAGGCYCPPSFLGAMVVHPCSSLCWFGSPRWLPGFSVPRLFDGSGTSSCGYACCEDARGSRGGVGCQRGCTHSSLAPSFVTVPFAVGSGRRRWVGVRGLGESLDSDARGRHVLLGGVLLVPLLLPATICG
jgi:hypothetical protein